MPHDRLKKAWVVDMAALEEDLPVKSVIFQSRFTHKGMIELGCWTVVGWDTRGMILVEPMKGTRDNMLPGDRFHKIK